MFDSMDRRSIYGGYEIPNTNLVNDAFNGVNLLPFFRVTPLGDQKPDPT
ncbi:MAG: hypothetical protein PVF58_14815 [Candidatus Methanofastidiosia archaeon]|jgi:hypothetical protein